MAKIAGIFDERWDTSCCKVSEGIGAKNTVRHQIFEEARTAHFPKIRGWLEQAESRSDLKVAPEIQERLKPLQNPVRRLNEYFEGTSDLNEDDLVAIAFYMQHKLGELVDVVRKMDA